LHTGMRRGEIFNLKWFDLDFDRALIQVRKTKTKLNRVVPMNARVREVLNEQRRTSEFVFTSLKTGGRLLDPKTGGSATGLRIIVRRRASEASSNTKLGDLSYGFANLVRPELYREGRATNPWPTTRIRKKSRPAR
jgi:integrase